MTYTADTPILGRGAVSAEAIQAWFAARGPAYASYAPDGRYKPPPEGLGVAIVAECQRYAGQTVGWDMVAAQMLHETAAWQSRYARERNNPGGIGAINSDPDQAIMFPSVEAGVRAHIAHLLVYAAGDGPWRGDDPRYDAVQKAGWVGVATHWRDLNGRWAWPGATYAQQIATLANGLVSFANDGSWAMPDDDIPIIQMMLPSGASNAPTGSSARMTPRWITIHETANPTRGADAVMHGKWLLSLASQGAGEPSWHYTVDDHQIVQHLPINRAGYHAGDGADGTGNLQSIGIELCVNNDGDVQKTRDNAAWLVRKLRGETGIPVNRVVQHNHWSGKNCPTLLRKSGWAAFVEACRTATTEGPVRPPDVGDPDAKYIPETSTWLQWGFKAFWFGMDAELRLKVLGYPISNEIGVNGRVSIQRFQRGVLIYDASQPDGWQITALPLDRYKEFGLEAA